MEARVHLEIKDAVADVRLARPEKLNALDIPMFEALVETGRRLAREPGLRAVVLSGEGRAFCAGLDFPSVMSGPDGGAKRDLFERGPGEIANFVQAAAWVWREMPVPVIAAVHGIAYGGGLQIALATDIRFVAADTRLSVRELHWGLVPDMTGTQTLRHLVRLDVAKELTYTARVVSGSEALALGLCTHLSETPRDSALELAREIAGQSPSAVRAAKQLLDDAPYGSAAEGLQREERVQRSVIGKPNQLEAVRANLEKRDPLFSDPE